MSFRRYDGCIYNLIHVKFNENMQRDGYFYYDLQFPTFYNFNNTYFNVNPHILDSINTLIKTDAYTFKNGLLKEFNESQETIRYTVLSTYNVSFSKNHILSTKLNLMAFNGKSVGGYSQINNYNFDLLTGNEIFLKDIFNPGVDYIKNITEYINYKIIQNKEWYYEDVFIDIPQDQAFYLTEDGIIIYFELDQIAPIEFGIPKFKIPFKKFESYINPRFYCNPQNIYYSPIRKSKLRK
jgi:hypothetical protein